MASDLDVARIFESLGKLTESVNSLRREFERFEEISAENRVVVRERLDELNERVSSVETKVIDLKEDLTDDVMPTINKVQIWEQRGIGFLAAAGMVGTGLGAVMASTLWYFWDRLKAVVNGL